MHSFLGTFRYPRMDRGMSDYELVRGQNMELGACLRGTFTRDELEQLIEGMKQEDENFRLPDQILQGDLVEVLNGEYAGDRGLVEYLHPREKTADVRLDSGRRVICLIKDLVLRQARRR